MSLNTIYRKYFQKSKVFIYPLLGVKRGNSVIPIETYISWENHYTCHDMKLICLYDVRQDVEYKNFEKNILTKHSRLTDFVKNANKSIFVFDFSDLEDDWGYILDGRYSKLKLSTKNKILKFFDKHSGNYAYMYSYLIPEKHFDEYSHILGVDSELLKQVGELCNKPNLEKETLIMEIADLDNIKDPITNKNKNQKNE
tara:strand:+ start:80 stop:673 length:594 start_codon:yes stop_codon:yes gene_type:complete